jgi:hypothetical protein
MLLRALRSVNPGANAAFDPVKFAYARVRAALVRRPCAKSKHARLFTFSSSNFRPPRPGAVTQKTVSFDANEHSKETKR